MYPILRGEMAKRGINLLNLSDMTGIRYQTLTLKVRGESELSLKEANKIKEVLGTAMTLEELFSTEFED